MYLTSSTKIILSSNFIFTTTSTTKLINANSLGDFVEVNLEERGLKSTDLSVPKKYTYGIGLGNLNKWFIGAQIEKKFSSNFKNEFLNIIMAKSFQFALEKISEAFQKRAETLFGKS